MKFATQVQMRKSLELVQDLKEAGILFVPMPVVSEEDYKAKLVSAVDIAESLIKELEAEEEADGQHTG